MVRLLISLALVTLALSSIIIPPSSINLNRLGSASPQQALNTQPSNQNSGSSTSSSTSSALNSIQIMKSLLTQKYQDMMGGKSPTQELIITNKDANHASTQDIKNTMKEYQKQLMNQYNTTQSNMTTNSSGDNIDNGLNNSIKGAQNIIYEGNSNTIHGVSNKVNGSHNVIGGKSHFIQVRDRLYTVTEMW
jgi:hypothetical protein